MSALNKYPRTPHIQGSRLQPGDEDLASVPFAEVEGRFLVVEEKMDGGNAGISFGADGTLYLQSRGHFLSGGPRERHFALFKQWASAHATALWEILGARYILYGEWLYAKHTVFYDALSHYFMEFDILDRDTGHFLSTERRRQMLAGSPVTQVAVLWQGQPHSLSALTRMVAPSLFKSGAFRQRLSEAARSRKLDEARIAAETDPSDLMEGLYLKWEEDGQVRGRYKYVRASFLTTVLDSGTHWLDRPILPNQLRQGIDIFSGAS